MKVSRNFTRSEFACKCGCGFAAADSELLMVLEDVREHFNDKPVRINSGCRCNEHNAKVGGSSGSVHTKGMAADLTVDTVPAYVVSEYLRARYPDRYGVGQYSTWTHVDVLPGPARRWGFA